MLRRHPAALLLAATCVSVARAAAPPPCSMAPRFETLRLPEKGVIWLEGEDSTGPCDEVAPDRWIRRAWKETDLLIHPDGPEGSGLYYLVTIGIARKDDAQPHRGVCFSATAVGARTLGGSWRRVLTYFESPNRPTLTNLPWVDDLDADGQTELIVWDSFPIVDDPAVYQFGLVAWVYRLQAVGTIAIDWKLSRRIADEIAAAYRASLKHDRSRGGPVDVKLSKAAADALAAFANGKCVTTARPVP